VMRQCPSRPRSRQRQRRFAQRLLSGVLAALLCSLLGGSAAFAAEPTVGTALAWGANTYGELGNGTTTNSSAAVGVTGLATGVLTLVAGARHSLAILSDGSVKSWGRNGAGELGNGTTTNSSVPIGVSGLGALSGVVAVAGNAPPLSTLNPSGNGHSMALKSDGTVLGWGNNNSGEVGNGTIIDQLTPVSVSGLGSGSGVVAIAAGGSHSLALKSDGTVLAWGNNASGQLGDGTAPTDHPAPVQVSGLGPFSGVVAIAAGDAFSMAVKSNGTVLAWGNNASGELGDGTAPTDHPTPVQVSGLGSGSGVVGIAAGAAFGLARKSDGTVLAWGNNASGELGDGTAPTDHATPVQVSGLGPGSGVVSLSAGFSHAMARKSNATLLAWGRNASGQLGDGTTTQHNTPEVLAGRDGVAAISAGGSHTLVLRTPVVTVSPTSGPPGTHVTVSGTHFFAGEVVKAFYKTRLAAPAPSTILICSATANGAGTFGCSGNIPTTNQGPAEAHGIIGKGATSLLKGKAIFTLT
jgi:alpha-tubulin suppressor-like RCC1 family protein